MFCFTTIHIMKSYKFIITGKVQGVYYRKSILNKARSANFSGYVKNLPDRSVEAVVTCEPHKLNSFIGMLKEGSLNSVVENVQQFDSDEMHEGQFKIAYST
jgi:acylphosphatase